MSYRAGFARVDITVYEPAMAMLGWAQPHNRVDGVASPLFARAVVVERDGVKFAYVCADLNLISFALRRGVLAALARDHSPRGFTPSSVMLTATHTHSGPSGFSQHVMYNAANYGFSPRVWSALVDGLVAAVVAADDAREPATLRLGESMVPLDEPIAFNRSLAAYRANGDVDPRATPESAVDRRSVTLRVDDAGGRALGAVNWFGVHATNVHADHTALHGDNKGLAALRFEREAAGGAVFRPGFVAIFAQGAAADVQPNFRLDRARSLLVGASDDDLESAAYNAAIQCRHARLAFDRAAARAPLDGPILARSMRADLGATDADADLAGTRRARTSPAHVGLGQAAGTAEGPGPLLPLEPWLRRYAALRQRIDPAGDPKPYFLEVGRGISGRVLGAISTRRALPYVARFEPMVAFAHAAHRAGDLRPDEPWVPNVLPLQLVEIGDLALVALPAEATVNAARRLRATVAEALARDGRPPRAVIVNGYANAYAGYVTTREEYVRQGYEGAATYYGPDTLAAYGTLLRRLARAAPGGDEEGPAPEPFDPLALIRQRVSGRRGVRGAGTGAGVPAPAHLDHLRAFSRHLTADLFEPATP